MTEAASFYESRRLGLGERFLDLVETTVQQLADAPLSGSRITTTRNPQPLDVRRKLLPGFPFALVYVTAPSLVVVAVAHTKRRPRYWASRLTEIR